ncbi:hypothetical protein WR25_16096 [Diploscapter pachys]|uniref:Uncharacterized protein n=1 Tax=Diploscapter pachys TaxID=2018661 RepID=A0A2A2JXC5_9BILA|nr:hypothetical protein WR25_16096 [Diploscapter pachys]
MKLSVMQKSTLTYDAFSKQLKGLTSEKKKLLDQTLIASAVNKFNQIKKYYVDEIKPKLSPETVKFMDSQVDIYKSLVSFLEKPMTEQSNQFMAKLGKDGLKNIDTVFDEAYNDVYLKLRAHAEKIGLNDDIKKLVDKKIFEFPSKIKYFE